MEAIDRFNDRFENLDTPEARAKRATERAEYEARYEAARRARANTRDCKHGHLARSCELCEMERVKAKYDDLWSAANELANASRTWLSETSPGQHINSAVGRSRTRRALERIESLLAGRDYQPPVIDDQNAQ